MNSGWYGTGEGGSPTSVAAKVSKGADKNSTACNDYDDGDCGDLFRPVPKRRDCAVCLLPLPNDIEKGSTYKTCCGQTMCLGCMCEIKYTVDEQNEERLAKMGANPGLELPLIEFKCAYCSAPEPDTNTREGQKVYMGRLQKRMDLGDPLAYFVKYGDYSCGIHGVRRNMRKAYEYLQKAAELGSSDGYLKLSTFHCENAHEVGNRVDRDKEIHYLKLAVAKGNVAARHNLGYLYKEDGRRDLAYKHWIVSASHGDDLSLRSISFGYRSGYVTKEQYAAVLRAHKDYTDAEKSDAREMAYLAKMENLSLFLRETKQ